MSIVAERVSRAQISDPRPTRCSACLTASDPKVRFVNLGASIDRGAIVDAVSGAVLESIDELHLCEACVREAAETIDYKPALHARHLQLNRLLCAEAERLRDENATLRRLLAGDESTG